MNVCSGFDSIVNECQTKYVISTDSYYLTLLHTNDTQQRKCTTSVYAYNWCYPNEKTLTIITVPYTISIEMCACIFYSESKKNIVKNVLKLLFSTHFIHMGLQPLYTVTKQQNTHCRSYTSTTSDVLNFIRTFVLRTIVLFWCVAIFFLLMIAYLYTQIQIII